MPTNMDSQRKFVIPVSHHQCHSIFKKIEMNSLHYLDAELWKVGLALHCTLTCSIWFAFDMQTTKIYYHGYWSTFGVSLLTEWESKKRLGDDKDENAHSINSKSCKTHSPIPQQTASVLIISTARTRLVLIWSIRVKILNILKITSF